MKTPTLVPKKTRNYITFIIILGFIFLSLFSTFGAAAALLIYHKTSLKPFVETKKSGIFYMTSCDNMKKQFEQYSNYQGNYGAMDEAMNFYSPQKSISNRSIGSGTQDYTNTNVQVAGIDEGDIVKTNGKALFIIKQGQSKISILKILPLSDTKKVGEINFSESNLKKTQGSPIEMLIYENKLIVFSNSYNQSDNFDFGMKRAISSYSPVSQSVSISVYDISNIEKVSNLYDIDLEGRFITSRLKDGYVYLVTNKYAESFDQPIPMYRDNREGSEFKKSSNCEDVAVLDKDYVYPSFTTVAALDVSRDNSKVHIQNYIGNTQTVYMGEESIYLVSSRQDYIRPMRMLPFIGNRSSTNNDYSVLDKLSYSKDKISFVAATKFEGHLLNQFSLDEFENHLRIAGTIGEITNGDSKNYLAIYDEKLNKVSSIDDLAKGEKIYSVRFDGKTGVVVTFKKVDPLFVFDLSNPKNPKLKGALKIPGYSDYLHFIDDNTVVGFGKDAIEADELLKDQRNLDFAWYQGLKLAIFDITDPTNPKELSKIMLGDRGSDSPALLDHKAFTFDPVHNLIIFPASISKIDQSTCIQAQIQSPCYGKPISQGAEIIKIKSNKSLEFMGEISHGSISTSNYYYSDQLNNVSRGLVIGESIVTVSDGMVKINSIDGLKETNSIKI